MINQIEIEIASLGLSHNVLKQLPHITLLALFTSIIIFLNYDFLYFKLDIINLIDNLQFKD